MSRIVYESARFTANLPFKPFWRLNVSGTEFVPAQGAAILVCNHISHFDPIFLTEAVPRQVHYMTSAEFFAVPVLGRILTAADCFPIDRFSKDRKAVKTALERLRAGHLLGLFPEGGLRSGERSVLNGAPLQPGVAALAQMASAPVIPACVAGTDRIYAPREWGRRRGLWVRFGRPFFAGKNEGREEFSGRVADAMRGVFEELKNAVPLGEDDLPQTAQRRKGKE
ncbi:lysophospholipid acyltransferase family protein [Oscillatoria amoena NRMC-F 0135]|nr:lysophospholipid acyltransferase family protein [Oscillatoria amoena NRMC-F 0135]